MGSVFNDYIGIPYESRGRSKEGADCWGLVYLVQREIFGLAVPDLISAYINADDLHESSAAIEISRVLVPNQKVDTPRTGDIVLVAYRGLVAHTGVFIEPNKILHTERGKASIVEKIEHLEHRSRVEGYYRVSESLRFKESVL